MSTRLAFSAALSVLIMAAYVLFGGNAAQAPLGPEGAGTPLQVSAPLLPDAGRQLRALLPWRR